MSTHSWQDPQSLLGEEANLGTPDGLDIKSKLGLAELIFHAFVSDKIGAWVSRVSELNIIQIMFK